MSFLSPRDPVYFDEMVWTPGQGPDAVALHDLRGRFGLPSVPLGEAWFMGKTRLLFDDLNAHGIEGVSERELEKALGELVSGLAYFPGVTAWPEWYGYLTPRILSAPRSLEADWPFEADLHGNLCAGLLALSLCNSKDPVTRFEADFAAVLSPWIMNARFWQRGQYLPLPGEPGWREARSVFGIDPDISTSLLLTWRYLRPEALRAWLRSILSIEDVLWRAHFLVWLIQVWPIFEQEASHYPVLEECEIDGLWTRFRTLTILVREHPERQRWHLIPRENIAAFRSALREEFDQQTYLAWTDQFAAQPELWPQKELWLEEVASKYLGADPD